MAARPMACPSQDSRFVELQVTWRKVLLFRVGATHFLVKWGGETVTLCQIVFFWTCVDCSSNWLHKNQHAAPDGVCLPALPTVACLVQSCSQEPPLDCSLACQVVWLLSHQPPLWLLYPRVCKPFSNGTWILRLLIGCVSSHQITPWLVCSFLTACNMAPPVACSHVCWVPYPYHNWVLCSLSSILEWIFCKRCWDVC